ncbi:MAG: DUF2242 domain-containing protein [Proteobacteria bacterium]|nr:DUF2242 domain-containing protein [Pseudomonadota bacterium]
MSALSPLLPPLLIAAALLAGCSLWGGEHSAEAASKIYQAERFQSDETFSRLFDASVTDTCEAARRALLSQGYIITDTVAGKVAAVKRFQPEGERHVELSFTVVCVPEGADGRIATAYASAQQDNYVVKKSSNATSIGVSAIGSISVPLSAQLDGVVKVGSETIPAGPFYDRFFALMQRMLRDQGALGADAPPSAPASMPTVTADR